MKEQLCTLKDVDQAAEELMALGCKVGATHINDGVARLTFLGEIKAFAEEVYQDIEEGVEAFWDEHEALRDKAAFYLINGITMAGGVAQFELGVAVSGASYGLGAPLGMLLMSHGANNIYEGFGNIYNGPKLPSTVGPVRYLYQQRMGSTYKGNMAYGSMDLVLSAAGLMRFSRKEKTVQLFRYDPNNYERAFKQASRTALFFEALVDATTIYSMSKEEKPE